MSFDGNLEELFKEYFPGLEKDILSVESQGTDAILVRLAQNRTVLFGREKDGIFLRTVSQEKPSIQ